MTIKIIVITVVTLVYLYELYLNRLPETVTVKSKKGNGKEKKKGLLARLFSK